MSYSNTATIARAETYQSFARLFLLEPDGESLAALQNDARFVEAKPFDARALRVEFTRLFALNVFPYASVFLDAAAALGTETTARVEGAYDRAGFEIQRDWPIGASDHLGAELAFVAYLLQADREPEADRFLAAEVLPWAGIFLHAVEQNAREPFYRVVARAARAWLFDETAARRMNFIVDSQFDASTWLEEDDLSSIIAYLVSPARSGIFLSKDAIAKIARALNLPTSFGDRALMLKSLFHAAGESDLIAPLLDALHAEIKTWIDIYESDARAYPDAVAVAEVWLSRARAARAYLRKMTNAAQNIEATR